MNRVSTQANSHVIDSCGRMRVQSFAVQQFPEGLCVSVGPFQGPDA